MNMTNIFSSLKGGNDHALYSHPKVKGFAIKGPQETREISQKLFVD
jgi:hypothetical protein